MTINHIFVIGAGTMGNGIAQVAATSGYNVTCMDVMPAALEKARAAIAKSTSRLLEKGTHHTPTRKPARTGSASSTPMTPCRTRTSSSKPPPKTPS